MSKTFLSLFILLACVILITNASRSIIDTYQVGSTYQERKRQTERQYLEVIKKKNELDYINSPFFVEKQLRESLNFYRKGEKLLVFTEQPATTFQNDTDKTTDPYTEWKNLFLYGIADPL